mmetsp:Transcript_48783/g.113074  ORF Transcript_48783/g.113074 Transcript_48783/m.113074 type:complete len:94 (-) Transcript_48783:64-345(-)
MASLFTRSSVQCGARAQPVAWTLRTWLQGDESNYPNGAYVDCFRYAKRVLGLRTTVHAGEFPDTSATEVSSAVLEMEVDRVGHAMRVPGTQPP